jgi:hypothetical protein
MSAVLTEIVEILVGGITSMATGIGSGLNAMAQGLFLDGTDSKKLSVFGGIVAIFGGIALAVGLTTLVTKWIMSLGARN